METDTLLPVEILEKIGRSLATVIEIPACYCFEGIFVNDANCKCNRRRYQFCDGVPDLVAFSATCRRFRARLRVREDRIKWIRRRLLFLSSLIDMRVLYAIGNNLAASEQARMAAEQRAARSSACHSRIPLLDALDRIGRERALSRENSADSDRHCPSMSGRIKSLAFRPRFCNCAKKAAIPAVGPGDRHTVVRWCDRCKLAIMTDEEDRTVSAEW